MTAYFSNTLYLEYYMMAKLIKIGHISQWNLLFKFYGI